MLRKHNLIIFNILFIVLMEFTLKLFIFNNFFSLSTLIILLFSINTALILSIIESLFNTTVNKIITICFSFIITLVFLSQFIYYQYYETFFSIYSLFHGAQVLEFIGSILTVILRNIIPILLMLTPIISLIIFMKRLNFERNKLNFYIFALLSAITLFVIPLLIIEIKKESTYSSYNLYYSVHVPKLTVKDFGLITEMRLDAKRTIFGFKEKIISNNNDIEEIDKEKIYHTLDIDFENLISSETNETIKSMHEYFSSILPSEENEYTGMFEGKNLIYIVAEAFSPMAINEQLTPTLYKLYNEGFKFKNFYTPVFFVSTSDGEYTTLTSLLPKDGVWSMSRSSDISLPFVYGNLFKNYGYTTNAYHDGTYTYYNRDKSLPNMGYTYKACYHGLNINCSSWPQSDVEMIEASTNEYINNDKFMVYYLTVSGHLQYNFYGNNMAIKNKEYVKDLPYDDSIKAYLSTQIELDKAVELLIQKLSESGKLEDTVIAISADHYPYGLSSEQILGYADYVEDTKFDIHKNSFILWNSNMGKSIEVDKYASSLDILPTVLNLFGVGYDSRLLIGKDVLSNEEGLVIFNDRSWITEKGKYNATDDIFTPLKEDIDDSYVENINSIVYNKFLMSKLILENNYYSKIMVIEKAS